MARFLFAGPGHRRVSRTKARAEGNFVTGVYFPDERRIVSCMTSTSPRPVRPTKSTWALQYAQANVHFINGTYYAFLPGCNDPIASDTDVAEVLESCEASYLERIREANAERAEAAEEAAYEAAMADACGWDADAEQRWEARRDQEAFG